jgi:EAL domain-containing protein (putative c-di-GMP-specific phosphodiesterase class I)
LIRLKENDEFITPIHFLPSAERYNLSIKIDEWVVRNVFQWMASKKNRLNKIHHCTINLSGLSIDNEMFLEYVLYHLRTSKIPGEKICFEITETAAIANLAKATRFINRLNSHGCLFALDDFGSGVSSFGYLKNLPVDYIKIDGSFIKNMMNDPIDLAMTRSINDIAHVMGKKTIAEFVVDEQILNMLKKIGVDYAQGYAIGRPRKINLPCHE